MAGTSGFPPMQVEPGAQIAQFTLVLAKNDVGLAFFLLTDAMARIANAKEIKDPRKMAEAAIELINTAFPPPGEPGPSGSTPPAEGGTPSSGTPGS